MNGQQGLNLEEPVCLMKLDQGAHQCRALKTTLIMLTLSFEQTDRLLCLKLLRC